MEFLINKEGEDPHKKGLETIIETIGVKQYQLESAQDSAEYWHEHYHEIKEERDSLYRECKEKASIGAKRMKELEEQIEKLKSNEESTLRAISKQNKKNRELLENLENLKKQAKRDKALTRRLENSLEKEKEKSKKLRAQVKKLKEKK